eukprot:2979631-Rhodomonas_salina.1
MVVVMMVDILIVIVTRIDDGGDDDIKMLVYDVPRADAQYTVNRARDASRVVFFLPGVQPHDRPHSRYKCPPYAPATRCPIVSYHMGYQRTSHYAVSGTDITVIQKPLYLLSP